MPKANKKNLYLDRPSKSRGYMSGDDRTWDGEDAQTHIYNWYKQMHLAEAELRKYIRQVILAEETIAIGQCYPFAVNMAKESQVSDRNDLNKFKVVHARVNDRFSGESYDHAWVEKGGMVFSDQTKMTKPEGIPKDVYYDLYQPEISKEYTAAETIVNCVNTGHAGPWK